MFIFSRVYGLHIEDSDWDLILVFTNDYEYQHLAQNKHYKSMDEIFKLVEGKEIFTLMITCGNINAGVYTSVECCAGTFHLGVILL
jgi:hypothetical protein